MNKLTKWILLGLPVVVVVCVVLYKTVLFPEGTARLSWTAPTENENNEPLTDLAGYNIHCWAEGGQYANTFYVDDPETTRYVIEELAPGMYLCAISAVNTDGLQSALSNVVTKTVH